MTTVSATACPQQSLGNNTFTLGPNAGVKSATDIPAEGYDYWEEGTYLETIITKPSVPAQNNVSVGFSAAQNVQGRDNTFVGANSGGSLTNAQSCMVIGFKAGTNMAADYIRNNDNLFVGANSALLADRTVNNLILGGGSTTSGPLSNVVTIGAKATNENGNSLQLGGLGNKFFFCRGLENARYNSNSNMPGDDKLRKSLWYQSVIDRQARDRGYYDELPQQVRNVSMWTEKKQ